MNRSVAALSDDLFRRAVGNPLLAPNRWPYRINAVMNAGATMVGDETILLCRVEDRRGISHLSVARSRDGVSNWVVDEKPLLAPDLARPEETWGLEDARISRIDELDLWTITYTTFGPGGPAVALATTRDFRTVERLGIIRPAEDKNAALLSRRVGGQFILFHRPMTASGGRADIWLSRSPDLQQWGEPEPVMGARTGGWWDSARIGIGPPPLETAEGWLLIYHGVRQTVAGALYRAGLALLDLDDPAKVIARCEEWVLGPREHYELVGDVPGVVFPCGLIWDEPSDELRLYYGAADTCIAMATSTLTEVLTHLREGH